MTTEMPWGDVSADQDPGESAEESDLVPPEAGQGRGRGLPGSPSGGHSSVALASIHRDEEEIMSETSYQDRVSSTKTDCPGEERGEAMKSRAGPSLSLPPPQCQEPPPPHPRAGSPTPRSSGPGSSLLLAAVPRIFFGSDSPSERAAEQEGNFSGD